MFARGAAAQQQWAGRAPLEGRNAYGTGRALGSRKRYRLCDGLLCRLPSGGGGGRRSWNRRRIERQRCKGMWLWATLLYCTYVLPALLIFFSGYGARSGSTRTTPLRLLFTVGHSAALCSINDTGGVRCVARTSCASTTQGATAFKNRENLSAHVAKKKKPSRCFICRKQSSCAVSESSVH